MTGRSERLASLTGVLFVIILAASVAAPGGSQPKTTATGAKVIAYATKHQGGLRASAILIGISLLVGLLFYGQLRALLRRDPGVERFAAVSFGGAVLFAASGGLAGGVMLALADQPKKLDPAAAQTLNLLSIDLPMTASAGVGVLMFAAGIAIVRSRALPVWLGWEASLSASSACFRLGSSP